MIRQIGSPKWPWPADAKLAAAGQVIFDRFTLQGGCAECHQIAFGTTEKTWHTPILDVGTDTHEVQLLKTTVQTGVLKGAKIPFLTTPLQPTDTAFNVLSLPGIRPLLPDRPLVLAPPKRALVMVDLGLPGGRQWAAANGRLCAPRFAH